jgi:hypothetical protein
MRYTSKKHDGLPEIIWVEAFKTSAHCQEIFIVAEGLGRGTKSVMLTSYRCRDLKATKDGWQLRLKVGRDALRPGIYADLIFDGVEKPVGNTEPDRIIVYGLRDDALTYTKKGESE